MAETGVEQLVARIRRRQEWTPEKRRAVRDAARVSTREMGAALGVTHAAVAQWEKGTHNPQSWDNEDRYFDLLEALQEIADGLD